MIKINWYRSPSENKPVYVLEASKPTGDDSGKVYSQLIVTINQREECNLLFGINQETYEYWEPEGFIDIFGGDFSRKLKPKRDSKDGAIYGYDLWIIKKPKIVKINYIKPHIRHPKRTIIKTTYPNCKFQTIDEIKIEYYRKYYMIEDL